MWVPFSSAWAFLFSNNNIAFSHFYERNSLANALTFVGVPEIILFTFLRVTLTNAFLWIPIIAVIKASFRNAFPVAFQDVESIVFWVKILHSANTSIEVFIEVCRVTVNIFAIGWNKMFLAVFQREVMKLIWWLDVEATALARRWVEVVTLRACRIKTAFARASLRVPVLSCGAWLN